MLLSNRAQKIVIFGASEIKTCPVYSLHLSGFVENFYNPILSYDEVPLNMNILEIPKIVLQSSEPLQVLRECSSPSLDWEQSELIECVTFQQFLNTYIIIKPFLIWTILNTHYIGVGHLAIGPSSKLQV